MSATTSKTVGEVAAENSAAPRIFEKLGIDYCCGGSRTLEEACRTAGIGLEEIWDSLEMAEAASRAAAPDRDWNHEPLVDLIGHIRNTHHRFTRDEIDRIQPLLEKVCQVHGQNHPELLGIRETFAALANELKLHLMKEEMVLFPYVVRLEEAAVEHLPQPPAPFGSVRNPVTMMMNEHDGAGEALRQMRTASAGYTAPADGCASYRSLYQALADLEADLHRHIHLENNILFPRAIAMEQGR